MPPEVLTRETPILEQADVLPQEAAIVETYVRLGHLAISKLFTMEERWEYGVRFSLAPTENGPDSVQTVGQMGVQLSIDSRGVVTATHIARRHGENWRDLRVESDLTVADINGVLTGIFETANWSAIPSSHIQY